MKDRDEGLYAESELRRALRLERTELPPPLDVALLVERANETRPAGMLASLASHAVAYSAAAVLLGLAAIALPSLGPAVTADLVSGLQGLAASPPAPVTGALTIAQDPTVPIAALAALILAINHELAQRREPVHGVIPS